MKCTLCTEKTAIRDHSVFDGLSVDDRKKFANLFLQPNYKLLKFDDGENNGYVIFEENNQGFIFHLVNFTKMKTRKMTESFIQNQVYPYCIRRGLTFVQARAERLGMEKKLKKLGFKPYFGVLRRAVA